MDKYYYIAIAVILTFCGVVLLNAPAIPSFDDYYATLYCIKLYYFDNQDFVDRASVLLLRHNEHRILLSRLTAVLYYDVFRELNFFHLILFQNLFLIGFIGLMLYLYRRERQLNSVTFLFISIFLCSSSFWQVTQFYWGGIQHYTVFFFSFCCLVVLDKTQQMLSWKFLGASFLAVLAVLSFGNGFLALVMGLLLLFAQKKYRLLLPWLVLTLGLMCFALIIDKTASVPKSTFNVVWMGKLLFTFLGSFLYLNVPAVHYLNIICCMLVGLGVLAFWIWLSVTGYVFKKPLLYVLFSLPIVTGILISISRFESKAAGGVAPRYMFFTATIPVLIILILLDLKMIKWNQLKLGLPFFLLVWVVMSYQNYLCSQRLKAELDGTLQAWIRDKDLPLLINDPSSTQSEILNWAICNQILKDENFREGCAELKP